MATVAIRTAIEKILGGSIRIPAFQRGFVWTTDNIAFLAVPFILNQIGEKDRALAELEKWQDGTFRSSERLQT